MSLPAKRILCIQVQQFQGRKLPDFMVGGRVHASGLIEHHEFQRIAQSVRLSLLEEGVYILVRAGGVAPLKAVGGVVQHGCEG
jgi:hypothetical protein